MFRSDRVLLRPMKREDVARQHEFNQNPELYVLDCGHPRPVSIEAAVAEFEGGTKRDDNNAHFAIEAEEKYIGGITLMGLNDRNGNCELGITIGDRAYWGRGYGREAIKLMLHYGFHFLGKRRVVLTTHAKNERAIRCYRACGFVEEGRPRKVLWLAGEYVDLVNMSILREEWEAQER